MISLLGHYGLTNYICKLAGVTTEDLEQLALLEMESRKLAKVEEVTDG